MNKIKLHNKILGYRICRIAPERSARFLSKIVRSGFTLTEVDEGIFIIKESDHNSLKPIFNEFGADVSETMGLFGWLKRQRKRYGLALALLISLILAFISADTIWDIRISGNEIISTDAIMSELEKSGLEVGGNWRSIDKNKLESQILSTSDNISWININRRGSVAYIDIIEKQVYDKEEDIQYSNIVADRDCIIEQISVKKGYALVKVGDTVKKGDVLIAGIMGEGGEFCRADGVVIGRSWEDVIAHSEKEMEEKVYKPDKKCSFIIKIFNFPVNIFKNYGNSDIKYDIISNIKPLTFGKNRTLPISFITEYKREYTIVKRLRTDDELINAAREQMSELLAQKSKCAEIIKIRTVGEFTKTGYKMISHISYTQSIGQEKPFTVNQDH